MANHTKVLDIIQGLLYVCKEFFLGKHDVARNYPYLQTFSI